MSELRKLALGIVLVGVGMFMLLSSGSIFPYVGGVMGVVGAYFIIRSLFSGKI
jgi:hypothetical protein